MTSKIHIRRLALAGLLGAGAVALWLAGAPNGRAASATQDQDLAVTVATTIGWGSAGDCVQDMGTASFGTVPSGTTVQSSWFTGCVTSNKSFGVSAASSGLSNAGGTASIEAGALQLRTQALPTGVTAGDCTPACSFAAPRTIFTDAPAGTAAFTYDYQLSIGEVPNDTYSGTVTFTATAA